MPITPLPTPPSRQSPGTFATLADAFLAALVTFVTETNATADDINAASGFVGAAMAAKWVSGTAYADGVLVWSPITRLTYRRKGAGAGTTDPSADTANWAYYPVATQAEAEAGTSDLVLMSPLRVAQRITAILASQAEAEAGTDNAKLMTALKVFQAMKAYSDMVRSARSSNTILVASDIHHLIDITAGTFSQTVTAAATLGAGWSCIVVNNGTGVVTIDPNASETVNGAATLVLYSYEAGFLYCDGVNFQFQYISRLNKSGAGKLELIVTADTSITLPTSGTLATTANLASASTQAQMEAATDATTRVTPASVNWHPGVAKAWVTCGIAGGTPPAAHNITSITDDGDGGVTVTIATDFSSINYVIVGTVLQAASDTSAKTLRILSKTAGSFSAQVESLSDVISDPDGYFFVCFGDQ